MTYYRDDDEYDREQAYRDQVRAVYRNVIPFPKMVREPCGLCTDGRVTVGDGTEYPGGVLCSYCAGFGYLVTEQR